MLLRRKSEPGLPNTVVYKNAAVESPLYKPFRSHKFTQMLSSDSLSNDKTIPHLKVEPRKDRQKRMSVPTISVSHVTTTEEPSVNGTFLINKFGIEQSPSGARPKPNRSRRISLPIINTQTDASKDLNGVARSLAETQNDTERPSKRPSLPNIFGVQPRKTNDVSISEEHNFILPNMSLNTSAAKDGYILESHKLLALPQPARVSVRNINHSATKSKGESNPPGTRFRPKLVRRLSEPWIADHAAKHGNSYLMPLRRPSDTVVHGKSKYLPELPSVRDASFEGADIEHWLENVRPDEFEKLEELESSGDTETDQEIAALVDEHRSVSQMRGNFNDKWNKECTYWNDKRCFGVRNEEGCEQNTLVNEDLKDTSDFHDERSYTNTDFHKSVEEVNGLLRKLSTVDKSGQEAPVGRTDRMIVRRNTVAATENILSHSLKEYTPKQCWCLRCQIMNAMYFNGDETLENWGNYPCFRRKECIPDPASPKT